MLRHWLLLLSMLASAAALTNYSHYHSDAQYHCQDFRNSTRRTMPFWYHAAQNVISGLSSRIPKGEAFAAVCKSTFLCKFSFAGILDDDKVTLSLDGLKRIWTEHRSQVGSDSVNKDVTGEAAALTQTKTEDLTQTDNFSNKPTYFEIHY